MIDRRDKAGSSVWEVAASRSDAREAATTDVRREATWA